MCLHCSYLQSIAYPSSPRIYRTYPLCRPSCIAVGHEVIIRQMCEKYKRRETLGKKLFSCPSLFYVAGVRIRFTSGGSGSGSRSMIFVRGGSRSKVNLNIFINLKENRATFCFLFTHCSMKNLINAYCLPTLVGATLVER